MKKKKVKTPSPVIAKNKKAFRDYILFERFEAGIVLIGSEVKSVREHKVNFKDSYARIKDDELFLFNMHISPYSKARVQDIDPKRTRKLLLHRREIERLQGKLTDKSLTIIPVSIYLKDYLVKIELALAKGKTLKDKRRDLQREESDKEIKRALKSMKR